MVSWSLILSAATLIHPGMSPRALKRRGMLLCRLAWARPLLSRWVQRGPHALLWQQMERDPRFLGFLVWPYIHAGWQVDRRLDALSEHLRIVDGAFPWLALGEGDRWQVLSLDDLAPGLRLELDRAPWFVREGGLVFNLFQQDHRLMSVPFSLARQRDELMAYVGGIQGSNRANAREVYRNLTKALHGLRPRDFAMKMFQLFMQAMGVAQILCVADEYRHHRHPYFGGRSARALFLNYDEVWREHGGQRLASGFFRLAPTPAEKPIEAVPSRKRAMYRRRFQMVAALARALRNELPRSAAWSHLRPAQVPRRRGEPMAEDPFDHPGVREEVRGGGPR